MKRDVVARSARELGHRGPPAQRVRRLGVHVELEHPRDEQRRPRMHPCPPHPELGPRDLPPPRQRERHRPEPRHRAPVSRARRARIGRAPRDDLRIVERQPEQRLTGEVLMRRDPRQLLGHDAREVRRRVVRGAEQRLPPPPPRRAPANREPRGLPGPRARRPRGASPNRRRRSPWAGSRTACWAAAYARSRATCTIQKSASSVTTVGDVRVAPRPRTTPRSRALVVVARHDREPVLQHRRARLRGQGQPARHRPVANRHLRLPEGEPGRQDVGAHGGIDGGQQGARAPGRKRAQRPRAATPPEARPGGAWRERAPLPCIPNATSAALAASAAKKTRWVRGSTRGGGEGSKKLDVSRLMLVVPGIAPASPRESRREMTVPATFLARVLLLAVVGIVGSRCGRFVRYYTRPHICRCAYWWRSTAARGTRGEGLIPAPELERLPP